MQQAHVTGKKKKGGGIVQILPLTRRIFFFFYKRKENFKGQREEGMVAMMIFSGLDKTDKDDDTD